MKSQIIRRAASLYKEVVKATFQLSRDSQLKLIVTSLAFVSILSIVPFIGACLATFKLFGGFESVLPKLKDWIFSSLTAGVSEKILEGILTAIERLNSGALGISGIIFLIFTSTKLLSDIEKAVQKIWKVEENRPLWKRFLSYWGIILVAPLILAVAVGFLSSNLWVVSELLPARYILPLLGVLALYLIYQMSPNRKVNPKSAFLGALVAGVLFWFAKDLYFYATKNLLLINELYGSLAAIPIFLIWMQVLWTIFLFGVTLSASVQHVLYDTNEEVEEKAPSTH